MVSENSMLRKYQCANERGMTFRGDPSGFPMLFLHGGGQTRYAWGQPACMLAEKGCYALTLDLRGHGESD